MSSDDVSNTDNNTPEESGINATARPATRKRLLTLLLGAVVLSAGGYGLWWYLHGAHVVTTDNAYAHAENAEVTPAVGGTIAKVNVSDTQTVHQGDVLVQIDDADAKLALTQAEAQLASAIRKVEGYYANDDTLKAQEQSAAASQQQAAAQLESAEADFERARTDLRRRQSLKGTGSISGDELTRAENAFANAKAALSNAKAAKAQADAQVAASKGQREANEVMIRNTSVDTHPEVELARARRDAAKLDLERTTIKAPMDGIVAKRNVQVGERIQAGTPLMSIVPVSRIFVDANFKEDELPEVRVGQPVTVTSDLYGDDVVFHGTVTGLSGGTGSAFAAIPAQNATGNWIKVVQRLPVRIELKEAELAKHPLRVGLSMTVTIDTSVTSSNE
ncbi:efflux RND transporter periplasmic adaptor subunit [Pokkaliibacter sp. CJK22405]|uniref:HlyD family secretion protein n=1 Tax=Pokkaliibacter sp. CJK22405 TaxID=3384615 RepID=UPI00398513AE